ncbi:MAG: penicillin-binding protein 1B [Pseudomonadota bacterium]|nr:penicillin-binding protein 1B [Pseudomonadota bacterium]
MTTKTPRPPRSPRRARAREAPRPPRLRWGRVLLLLLACLAIVTVAALGAYVMHLDTLIRSQFEGRRWALPARVYARPLELFPGRPLSAGQFAAELALLRYRAVEEPRSPGTYARDGDTFRVVSRSFSFWDGAEPSQALRLTFAKDTVKDLTGFEETAALDLVRMDPVEIAGIYPSHNEDRILIQRQDLPPVLVDALIAVEDRKYHEHWGIDFKGIFRALVANLRAGRTVQGGSTLTQQLVKNYFLSNERTLRRKLNEMAMAVLLDWHYSKDEILEAYANEVYLGQDGNRAVHGLGLASRFYFDRPLAELDLHHIALLVGLIRGPSYYDPRRHPQRATARRNLVLDVMAQQNLISAADAATAKALPLDVIDRPQSGITRYPAFLDLVQRQLREDYREEDLTSEGLKIFTTLDPQVQEAAEQAIIARLPELEKKGKKDTGQLQAAAIVADTQTGEVLAVVGGRDVRLAGFNRALDARRLAGSLLKPAVFLTALEHPEYYTLATLLDDSSPFSYRAPNGTVWKPANYDKNYHGYVLLQDALARSYNIPTARVGMAVDLKRVINTLNRLGIRRDLRPYPSLLLGAVDLSPLEVAQMYETLASGGFRVPLRAIREVTAVDGKPVQRYPLSVEQVIQPGPAYLITKAMQSVVSSGTARAASQKLPSSLNLAGKTGTTDDLRDSWFAGFSGNRLAVVWLGRDDNAPMGLSGSTGALPVWIAMMDRLHLLPLDPVPPSNIQLAWIDPKTGLLSDRNCPGARQLPFIAGSAPPYSAPCGEAAFYSRGAPSPGGGPRPSAADPISDFFRRLTE